ncbi:MAG: prepilin-type N-terminal cleavage/methylation domain-containing protein [Gemmatimonadetes bacterium]|nr:prepilin-type N-terminal cleavage/methylation domain-containing protein [Gemmatimonadota bacterium]
MNHDRRGFTLVEVLLAVVILVLITTTFARFSTEFTKGMTGSSIRVVSAGVAQDRLELVRADPAIPGWRPSMPVGPALTPPGSPASRGCAGSPRSSATSPGPLPGTAPR